MAKLLAVLYVRIKLICVPSDDAENQSQVAAHSPIEAPLSMLPLPQLDYKFKMDCYGVIYERLVGWATSLLFTNCYVTENVRLSDVTQFQTNQNFIVFLDTF